MYQAIARHDRVSIIALVSEALRRGYKVSVHDGEVWAVNRSTNRDDIIHAMGETDSDMVRLRDTAGNVVGSFTLVYGNDPGETVSDYTDNAECEAIANIANNAR